MKKIAGFMVCFLVLAGFSASQQSTKIIGQWWETKQILKNDNLASIQVKNQDKPKACVLATYPVPDGLVPFHWIKRSNYSTLDFVVEYTDVFNSQVRFLFVWSGTDFYTFTTEWDSAKYNRFNFFYLTSDMKDWRPRNV